MSVPAPVWYPADQLLNQFLGFSDITLFQIPFNLRDCNGERDKSDGFFDAILVDGVCKEDLCWGLICLGFDIVRKEETEPIIGAI